MFLAPPRPPRVLLGLIFFYENSLAPPPVGGLCLLIPRPPPATCPLPQHGLLQRGSPALPQPRLVPSLCTPPPSGTRRMEDHRRPRQCRTRSIRRLRPSREPSLSLPAALIATMECQCGDCWVLSNDDETCLCVGRCDTSAVRGWCCRVREHTRTTAAAIFSSPSSSPPSFLPHFPPDRMLGTFGASPMSTPTAVTTWI